MSDLKASPPNNAVSNRQLYDKKLVLYRVTIKAAAQRSNGKSLNVTSVPQGSSGSSKKSGCDDWMTETCQSQQRVTCPTYSRQSSVSSRLTNIGLGQRQRNDSFVFPNNIFVKTVIQITTMMIVHQNSLGN
ncbi:hypothetical protein AVEN_58972-1 [Araneus ventricosus]|uniref:Uncharacterized protein n=1 Tax=Araneus ventricosus TaxID=182803 RepID=A0A4Y2TPI9_ARAVE|nr:hypothetical protein AVEN_58972-1 [Araneus ventricosus]